MSYATEQGVLNSQYNTEIDRAEAARASCAPHVLMRPLVIADGTMWICLYGENLANGVSGFGETPAKACAAFDEAWRNALTPAAIFAARSAVAEVEAP